MENLGSEAGSFYSQEGGHRDLASRENSPDSDFASGERDDSHSRKDSKLSVKRKEKDKDWDKDKKKDKDKGYAALEGESSADEAEMDMKSPFKGKKRSFKFSSAKKEKRKDEDKDKEKKKEKEKEKEKKDKVKELEAVPQDLQEEAKAEKKKEKRDKEKKEKDKEKEKKDKDKTKEDGKPKDSKKLKVKEKKKTKSEESGEDEFPVFGVPLEVAVMRCKCHDNVDLPLVVRNCIDFIEEHGLSCEGIYRSSGVKTRVMELQRAYNLRENVSLSNEEPPTVASLLKQYLRELPDNILTNAMLPNFEEAAALKISTQQEAALRDLISQLPKCNQQLLAWLFIHMIHVVEQERLNKMNVQNVSIVLSPTLNLSHRVLNALFANAPKLFAGTTIHKYVPPISGVSVELPTGLDALEAELKKQESLLMELHREVTLGSSSKVREEQLWEAQRIVTQLKRELKTKSRSATIRNDDELRLELAVPQPAEPGVEVKSGDAEVVQETEEKSQEKEESSSNSAEKETVESAGVEKVLEKPKEETEDSRKSEDDLSTPTVTEKCKFSEEETETVPNCDVVEEDDETTSPQEDLRLTVEIEERENLVAMLEERIKQEKRLIDELHGQLAETGNLKLSDSSDDEECHQYRHLTEEEQEQLLADILRENRELEEQNSELFYKIEEQREACVQLRVQLQLLERGYPVGAF